MKPFLTVLFTTVVLASTGFSASDPFAEERFKMKTGRNTPAAEARLTAIAQDNETGKMQCAVHVCCHKEKAPATTSAGRQFLNAKLGRHDSDSQARIGSAAMPRPTTATVAPGEAYLRAKLGITPSATQPSREAVVPVVNSCDCCE
jgi:hypothetical protein